ncbi:hypothetical protein Ec53638_A0403 (plasmid) [Escherichia coli 53638]|nr:hypothetical protein Ec53638_A0403 [Escherichia coli 53638]EFG2284149.1 hypothetical protein [Escherichia coli]EHD3375461.1 hypothetical protein [Escherichia coli O124]EFL0532457.1 hypothetical protein [Escherichia coli]EHD3430992.1 hypothetical protein [Escherichia coli O124]
MRPGIGASIKNGRLQYKNRPQKEKNTGVVGKAERLTWHKAWTMVSTGFSISYTSRVLRVSLNTVLRHLKNWHRIR